MTDTPQLNATQYEIKNMAMDAYYQLVRAIRGGSSPQAALERIEAQFAERYKVELAAAFSTILKEAIGARDIAGLNIGGLTLSARLYRHSKQLQAEVLNIINNHAAGFNDARRLALQLYEGYGFRRQDTLTVRAALPKYLQAAFGNDKAFRQLWAHEYVRSKLATLANNGLTGPELARVFARINAAKLKTPALRAAYTQALDQLEQGKGADVLKQALKTAYYERNRYFANRIAQTELHRAYTDKIAGELMGHPRIQYVQIRMSKTHPAIDVCDLHAKLDKYGLGPGVYPKASAPKPPFHPFCRCVVSPRIDLTGKTPVEVIDAERRYLQSIKPRDAVAIAGSREKLNSIFMGSDVLAILDAGKYTMYKTKFLGDFGSGAVAAVVSTVQAVAEAAKTFWSNATQWAIWHNRGFGNAPEWLKQNIKNCEGQFLGMIEDRKSGAYQLAGKICMGNYDPGAFDGQNTWRHEYGHFLDFRIGVNSGRGIYRSALPDFSEMMKAEADELTKIAGVTGRGKAAELARVAAATREAALQSELLALEKDQIRPYMEAACARAGITYDELENLFDGRIGVLDIDTIGGKFRALRLLSALEHRDAKAFAMALWAELGSTDFHNLRKVFPQAASLCDLIGCATRNKIGGHNVGSGGFGHSDTYLKSWGAGETEVFANFTAIYGAGTGSPGATVWQKIVEQLFPKLSKKYTEIMRDQV